MGTLRGDAAGLDPTCYRKPITLTDAQTMIDLLSERFSVELTERFTGMGERYPIQVRHGRNTKRRWGQCEWKSGPIIKLYPLGMNEGTVLHEFAHWLAGFGAKHGPAYQRAQRQAYAAWQRGA